MDCKSLKITHTNGIRTPFTLSNSMSAEYLSGLWGLPILKLNYLSNPATSGLVQSDDYNNFIILLSKQSLDWSIEKYTNFKNHRKITKQ